LTEVLEGEVDTMTKEKNKVKSTPVPHKPWEEEDVVYIDDDDDDDCSPEVVKQDTKACNKEPGN
jgi:hypothetical protein